MHIFYYLGSRLTWMESWVEAPYIVRVVRKNNYQFLQKIYNNSVKNLCLNFWVLLDLVNCQIQAKMKQHRLVPTHILQLDDQLTPSHP